MSSVLDSAPLVLMVEDEPIIRMIGVDNLQYAGYAVLEAGSAAEALEILERDPGVSVLFTDINMPGELDGVDLARLVNQRWPAIRLIVTSGRHLLKTCDLPDDGRFLSKPYVGRQVTEMVRELTGV